MKPIEFYNTPTGEVIIKSADESERTLSEKDTCFIQKFIEILREFYPDALNALNEIYGNSINRRYSNFLMIRRFIKCNLGLYDNRIDLDSNWNFKFEFVGCPLRGECKYDHILCQPKFNSKLSDRQAEVMKLLYEGNTDDQVADELFISLNTVNNHRKNSFKKLKIHSMPEFMRYATRNNMFN